jgi:hypothetical protein
VEAIMWTSFLLNLGGSVAALIALYGLYVLWPFLFSSDKASAEMWWLPAWKCFRLVIRNIPVGYEITDVRSKAWLRDVVSRRDGSSVDSFRDKDLVRSDRIMIPRADDFPLLCFRLQKVTDGFDFVLTDKFGTEIASHQLSKGFEELLVEYSVKIQTWKLFKYEIHRTFVIPYLDAAEGKVFEQVFAMQQEGEARFLVMFRRAEVIRVSI